MQIDTDLTGLFGITLAIVALLVRLPRVRNLPLRQKAALLAGAIIVVSIPVGGLSLAEFVRGITGDLSVFTLVLLAVSLARSLGGYALVGEMSRRAVLQAILLVAVLFYPLVLGIGMFDPYRLGYGNLWFMMALLGAAIWASLRSSALLALGLALAVAAWNAGWYESTNLWDYLIDPWLAIYAFASQVKYWLARLKVRKHA